jgi:hypothetical protein
MGSRAVSYHPGRSKDRPDLVTASLSALNLGQFPASLVLLTMADGYQHTATREDASINLAAVAEMCRPFPVLDILLIESGGGEPQFAYNSWATKEFDPVKGFPNQCPDLCSLDWAGGLFISAGFQADGAEGQREGGPQLLTFHRCQ